MHIGVVIWALYYSRGGIERFGIDLSAEMIRRGHHVTIFHAEQKSDDASPQYPVPPGANCVALPKKRRSPTMIDETRDRIVASGVDVLAALFSWDEVLRFPVALKGTGIPFLLSEHNAPRIIESRWNDDERRACLEAADRIHILSESYREGCPGYLNDRIEAIPNPVTKTIRNLPVQQDEPATKTILAVGRFDDHHKQFSLLIKAFSSVVAQFPDWRLTLCGDGQDRKSYEQLVASLDLQDRVHMPGMVSDIDGYYEKSQLFCIPSRFEGCPLVIPEAQCFALPVVGFAECSGTNDIVVHEKNGLLAAEMTAESLAQSLSLLMGDPGLRRRLGLCGREMLVRYDAEAIYGRWEELLGKAASAKNDTQLQRIFGKSAEEMTARKTLLDLFSRPVLFRKKGFFGKIKSKISAASVVRKTS